MNPGQSDTPTRLVDGVVFSLFSADDIKTLSVKEIVNPDTFDALNNPNPSGLYDSALGPFNRGDTCSTCKQQQPHCPGHVGHVHLPLPVYHPIFFKTFFQILKACCWSCNRILAKPWQVSVVQGQLKLASFGLLAEAGDLVQFAPDGVDEAGESDKSGSTVTEKVESILELAGLGGLDKPPIQALTRHSVDFRRQLVTDFLNAVKKENTCTHCGAPVRRLRQEQGVRIFAKPLSGQVANKWLANKEWQKKLESEAAARKDAEIDDSEVSLSALHQGLSWKEIVERELVRLTGQTLITPQEVRERLAEVWNEEKYFLQQLFGALALLARHPDSELSPMDVFFIHVLPVAPSCFRPVSEMGDRRFIHPETQNLAKILADNVALRELIANIKQSGGSDGKEANKIQTKWQELQTDVNALMDSDLLPKQPGERTAGVRQLLEKKEGLFRRHMMGKRVNFAARSVISPDLNINTDEIGIPQIFAKGLTYPQPVTSWNVQQLRKAIINGPNVHPGAHAVEMEDGSRVLVKGKDMAQRQALAKQLMTPSANAPRGSCKKVLRHLINGDVLLVNRQPTLHKPSIMAHKARVLPGEKTLRLHYANCKCYNADFDGDEMNAHFPQDELARAEAYTIASTSYQYLVPKDGTPLSGLIQDHMVAGVLMTIRGRMFEREDFQELLFRALPSNTGHVRLVPPCILKPKCLWSGKQVVSAVLFNIIPKGRELLNLGGKTKIVDKAWKNRKPRRSFLQTLKEGDMSESEVIIRRGELLCGVLDKAHFGSTQFSLVHACYELYGGATSGLVLSCLGKLFTAFLQIRHGFTLGVADILVKKKANHKRWEAMADMAKCGPEVIRTALGLKKDAPDDVVRLKHEAAHRAKDGLHIVDYAMKPRADSATNLINKICIIDGLYKRFPSNCLQLMVQSGAKGSMVNCMQISCLLGQIELEGHRPPLMPSGRSLPSFQPYDPSPRAGGFIDGRFLTGIQPQEYFFHCMAGREGLVDTAVKTSRSGYLQRCLIKHLESLQIHYDLTVRDCDGTIVQFNYGEDSLDILKTQYLTRKQLPFIVDNYQAFRQQCPTAAAEAALDLAKAAKHKKKVQRGLAKAAGMSSSVPQRNPSSSAFLAFCSKHRDLVDPKSVAQKDVLMGRTPVASELGTRWRDLDESQRRRFEKKGARCPDPALSVLRPDHYYGSVCEKLENLMDDYISDSVAKGVLAEGESAGDLSCLNESEDEEAAKVRSDQLSALINLKHIQSLAEPGECVGLLAAQSIGEPSTQMTLNTFHFAGKSEMNVTLGIPRLREILMTASPNIKTPAMDVPLRAVGPDACDDAAELKKRFTRVTLAQVLEDAEIYESLASRQGGNGVDRLRQYRIRLNFLPEDEYEEELMVTPALAIQAIESRFFRLLVANIRKVIATTQKARESSTNVIPETAVRSSRASGSALDSDADDALSDVDEEAADASSAKSHARRKERVSYEDPDDDEAALVQDDDSEGESSADEAATPPGERMDVAGGQYSGEDSDSSYEAPSGKRLRASSSSSKDAVQTRIKGVIKGSASVVDYKYDVQDSLWCEVILKFPIVNSKVMVSAILERTAQKFVVHEVPGVQRCFISESKEAGETDMWRLKTEGVNMEELFFYPELVDLNKLYTNNIHALAEVYGIEAARQAIVKEIAGVFKVYGIAVDYRHLSLIADYMTIEGSYRPFNRIGIESNRSPFQKMSFETTMHFLRQATVNGDSDNLSSPSARIVTGRSIFGGTGCMDIMQPLNPPSSSKDGL